MSRQQRDIKFRVWDNMGYMSSPFTLQDLQEGKIQYTKDCIVMQYTGLKDKEGNEIFEDDIICRYREKKGIDKKKIVKWHNAYVATGFNVSTTTENMKVIGNIHQNPDLIGKGGVDE